MGGRYLVGVAAAHRAAAGVAGGEEHEVTIEHDTESADGRDAAATWTPRSRVLACVSASTRSAYSARKEHVRSVEDAKQAETRQRRVTKIIEKLGG